MIKQLRYFPVLLPIAIGMLASCAGSGGNVVNHDSAAKNQQHDTVVVPQNVALTYRDTNFHLEIFQPVPDTIEGCSGYYATDSIQQKKQRFLFLKKPDDFALLKIKGQIIFISQQTDHQPGKKGTHYSGEGYDVYLDVKETNAHWESDESADYAGTLEIIRSGARQIIPVVGVEGC